MPLSHTEMMHLLKSTRFVAGFFVSWSLHAALNDSGGYLPPPPLEGRKVDRNCAGARTHVFVAESTIDGGWR